jgi:prepilin-type N-terminal cleavage/methylation domain-containing protein
MRIPERGEKGFTLIELLIVVAILGVLAAVVIPNVGRFIGRGETEAADTEFSNVQTAVVSMMVDNGLSELPTGFVDGTVIAATDNMTLFPHSTAACGTTAKEYDPDGDAYTGSDKDGYILYKHDIEADNSTATTVNYVAMEQTKGTYYVDKYGTVTQDSTGY